MTENHHYDYQKRKTWAEKNKQNFKLNVFVGTPKSFVLGEYILESDDYWPSEKANALVSANIT